MEAKACVRGLLALLFIIPMAAQAALFDSVSVGVGRDVHKGSDVSMLRVAAQIPWQKRWGEAGDWVWTGAWEAEVSAWHGNRGSTGNASLVEVGFRPVLRLERKVSSPGGVQPYVEAGLGAALLSKTRIDNRRFSTSFQFGSHVGAGVRFGQAMRYELSYRFMHYSNADIKKPNQGISFNTLNFGFRF
jgi:opacity protein-like surface antigen